MTANITESPSADFDFSNVIDGADFLAWQRGFGITSPDATKLDGDADNDLDVDGNDLTVWETQYGMSFVPLAAASAVTQGEQLTAQEQTTGLSDLRFDAEAVSAVFFAAPRSSIALVDENNARAFAIDNVFLRLDGSGKRVTDTLNTAKKHLGVTNPATQQLEEYSELLSDDVIRALLLTNARRTLHEKSKIVTDGSHARDYWDRYAFNTEIIDAIFGTTVGGEEERTWTVY